MPFTHSLQSKVVYYAYFPFATQIFVFLKDSNCFPFFKYLYLLIIIAPIFFTPHHRIKELMFKTYVIEENTGQRVYNLEVEDKP